MYGCKSTPTHPAFFSLTTAVLCRGKVCTSSALWFLSQSRKDKERPKQKHKKRPESPTSLTPSLVPVAAEKVPNLQDVSVGTEGRGKPLTLSGEGRAGEQRKGFVPVV